MIFILPFLNIETISGLPQEMVVSLLLNTESNSTTLSFHPYKIYILISNISNNEYRFCNTVKGKRF